jgi:hypothetical protein
MAPWQTPRGVLKLENEIIRRGNALLKQIGGKG